MLVWLLFLLLQRPVTAATVITRTERLPAGVHLLASADAAHPALIIRGSNITVEFTGVTLQGAPAGTDPDKFTGVAVFVDGGENVTIRNLTARGYKVGVLARGSKRLHITGADLSYNWKARLYSLVEHESLVDWLSFHHNDNDECESQNEIPAGLMLKNRPLAKALVQTNCRAKESAFQDDDGVIG